MNAPLCHDYIRTAQKSSSMPGVLSLCNMSVSSFITCLIRFLPTVFPLGLWPTHTCKTHRRTKVDLVEMAPQNQNQTNKNSINYFYLPGTKVHFLCTASSVKDQNQNRTTHQATLIEPLRTLKWIRELGSVKQQGGKG